jgi:hypothetical protein
MIYFNQTATWKSAGTPNSYNEPTYTSTTIKCRKQGVNKLVNNSLGQAVTSNSIIFTSSVIQVNDKIDDRLVLRVDAVYGLDSLSHYEVYLQ